MVYLKKYNNIFSRTKKHLQENTTSIASTKYSDKIETQAVIIKSQITDSHFEIWGVSSSSEPSSI